ncbi:PqqD family protein, partial [Dehalococcoidales bacterium]|nr:PqqD family protein [Dehalococcoidales bacterium]
KPGIVLHSLPDQDWFFAFNVETGEQFRLNHTSFWVLETISDSIEWIRLRDSFLETFDVSAHQGEADLRKLVNELYKQKIIRRRGHGEEENSV